MKSVLVTGAYGGMGKATVDELVRCGYRVFAIDVKSGEQREGVIPIIADITDEQSVKNAFTEIKKHTDELFGIIHFAGIYMLNSLVEMSEEEFDRIYKINLKGAFLINKSFLPMLRSGSRIIITTSELAPLAPLPFTGIYAVMKGALDKYAYSLRMELQLLGISVSVLRAGAVKTEMLGVSTTALDRFCESTEIYTCNAKKFKKIVHSVEARHISPEKIAKKTLKILKRKNPRFAYKINRNPLLLLLNALPPSLAFKIIKSILKAPKSQN